MDFGEVGAALFGLMCGLVIGFGLSLVLPRSRK